MPMYHKAYAFDWFRFELELYPLMVEALAARDSTELETFIDEHLEELCDPYEGKPLTSKWREMLENQDVHEHGD